MQSFLRNQIFAFLLVIISTHISYAAIGIGNVFLYDSNFNSIFNIKGTKINFFDTYTRAIHFYEHNNLLFIEIFLDSSLDLLYPTGLLGNYNMLTLMSITNTSANNFMNNLRPKYNKYNINHDIKFLQNIYFNKAYLVIPYLFFGHKFYMLPYYKYYTKLLPNISYICLGPIKNLDLIQEILLKKQIIQIWLEKNHCKEYGYNEIPARSDFFIIKVHLSSNNIKNA